MSATLGGTKYTTVNSNYGGLCNVAVSCTTCFVNSAFLQRDFALNSTQPLPMHTRETLGALFTAEGLSELNRLKKYPTIAFINHTAAQYPLLLLKIFAYVGFSGNGLFRPLNLIISQSARNLHMASAKKPVHGRVEDENNMTSTKKKLKSKDSGVAAFEVKVDAVSKVQQGRVRVLKAGIEGENVGPVVYWMSRDQRSRDNWALLYAVEQATKMKTSVAVAFNLVDDFLEARARHFGFMLRGLRVVESNLKSMGIPFFLFQGKAEENIPNFLVRCGASLLVMDFSPLRIARLWRENICKRVAEVTAVHEVDAHNIVPVWKASAKLEYSARTIRTRIQKQLDEYLVQFHDVKTPYQNWLADAPVDIDWDALLGTVLRTGAEVPEIHWCEPGENAAKEVLLGTKNGFLTARLKNYADDRNDPSKLLGLSGLSPYLHYGQISAQRCALEALTFRKTHPKSVDTFVEELVIRRELADNFCFYQPHYDTLQGAWEWARKTLMDHASDKREHNYTREQLEKAKTTDPLWNAAQLEMVHHGKMHGFMRMYWAKKILEWTRGPEEALAIAIYLNDKYEIDGRDPNGYVGCMWSICGVHDQGWQERPVFGKVRYMNYAGCKRKFNVDGYIMYVNRLVAEIKKQQATASTVATTS